MTPQDESLSFSRVLISGAGFLADAYDLFVINIVVDLMDKAGYKQDLTNSMKSNVKTMALIGAVVGQLGFGAVADLIGRRKVFITTCALVIFGALLSATVQDTTSFGIYSQLCLWRFLLGVGVGGEYPLSASITAESSQSSNMARNLAMVFSMQGLGTLLCAVVLVTVTQSMGENYNAQWRIAIALGALPMVCAFYFRWKMHETSWKEESKSTRESIELAVAKDRESVVLGSRTPSTVAYFVEGSITVWHTIVQHKWDLLGTAGAWFILDIVFYANGLFSGQVSEAMGFASDPKGEAVASLILNAIALPGYFCTIMFIDRIGAFQLQLNGFMATGIFFSFLAILQPYLIKVPALYIILYGITFFFQNFGANATTYIIPSIVYPTAHRATCCGISAAAGKLGAIVGAEIFLYITDSFCSGDNCTDDSPKSDVNKGLQLTFGICAILAFVGFVWSFFFVRFPVLEKLRVRRDEGNLAVSNEMSSSSNFSYPQGMTNSSEVESTSNPIAAMHDSL
jgi:MFS transporter, PHS family, inorganic phosphate transporter